MTGSRDRHFLALQLTMLAVGQAILDSTPPLGIEMAGFHKPPGQERRITGIRQATSVRALVLRVKRRSLAIITADVCAFSAEGARRIQRRVARATGIPADHVRVCATHTHSMPTLHPFRQWGAVPPGYVTRVEELAVQAVVAAQKDLSSADAYLGLERVVGGNFNRTSKLWRTDADFRSESTDSERWLDTHLHALMFLREGNRPPLVWYHFSAHPVCYQDDQAGPDWCGLVSAKARERDGWDPGFLQGRIGDVNPGDGVKWIGDAEPTSEAVWRALHHAVNHSVRLDVNELRVVTDRTRVPLDIARQAEWLAAYRADPAKCASGVWVDAGFAKDWFETSSKWRKRESTRRIPLTAVRLGPLGMLFHPAELYSYYGLRLRMESPFAGTLVVGYCDDFLGYLTDPDAFTNGEYAALVVPKILHLPPFTPHAAREFTERGLALLKRAT